METSSINQLKWQVVWRCISEEQIEQVVAFWTGLGILPSDEAYKRAQQVVIIIKNQIDEVIGISTAFYFQFDKLQAYVYAYRCLIKKEARVVGLETKLTIETKMALEADAKTILKNKPVGMLAVVQNKALKTKCNKAVWPDIELIYIGDTPTGDQYRISYFENARIEN